MHRGPRLLGAAVGAAGLLILAGWWLDVGLLATALPGWPPTRPNTALAFALAGAALLCLPDASPEARTSWLPRVSLGCALGAGAIGLLTLAEYVLSLELGIDGLLVGGVHQLTGATVDVRPPIGTAAGLTLLGAALALLHLGQTAVSVARVLLVMTAGAFALPVMDDLITGGPGQFRQSFGSMSVPAPLLVLTLSVAGLWARPFARLGEGAHRIERALPWAVIVFAAAVWLIARGIQRGSYDATAGVSAIAVASFLLIGLVLWASRLVAQSEDDFERFFALAADVLCIADFTGRFRRVNPAASRILGWSREELLARPFFEFVHPDDCAATRAEMDKLAGGDPTLSFYNRYQCKDGSWRWLSWTAHPRPAEGRIYAVARDVTEARRAREEIVRLNAELEAFSYSVSHDLRAPLRHANGFVQLLERHLGAGALDDKARHYLQTIAGATQRMGALIDDLLAFSRVSRADLRHQRVALDDLVVSVRNELKDQAAGRSVDWQIGALPDVEGDPSLLRQVFANLLSNALKYTRRREQAVIEIGVAPPNSDGTVIFVRDNGAGFDMQYKDKLFGVFQRLHSREEFEGTGIGLALVRRIVQRHGGTTWAEGKVGEGATFYISLPSREAEG